MHLSRQFIRINPWLIYAPLWIQWAILNFSGPGAWIGPTVLKQLLLGPRIDLNIIFPVTWTCAISSFIIIFFLLRNRTSLLNLLSISAASQFGAAFLFEFVFSVIARFLFGHHVLPLANKYYVIVGISWLSMSFCGIGFWSKNKFLLAFIGFFIVGFLIWILIGFPILKGIQSVFLNSITKIASFAIITSLYVEH